ncbi:MAG: ATP-binding protein [Ktedonobacteraceae bacterium]
MISIICSEVFSAIPNAVCPELQKIILSMPYGGELIIETENVMLNKSFCRQHPNVQPGEYVLICISDTGIGMDEQVQKHVFEPFFTTKELGTGILSSTKGY